MNTSIHDLTPTEIDREVKAFSAQRLSGKRLTPEEAGRYSDLLKARREGILPIPTRSIRKR